jgi:omega-hydroxy-beta-dihydromenaquinone-9 sulfotransferase
LPLAEETSQSRPSFDSLHQYRKPPCGVTIRTARMTRVEPKDLMPHARDGRYPHYTFRIWHGMGVKAWFGMLARNRFAVAPRRLPRIIEICIYSALNSALSAVQRLVYGRRVDRMSIEKPPIFIIGHWRAGTTLLHELLALDEQFTAPTTYECFAPGHFLISSFLVKRLTFFLPDKRPMDDMTVGWDRPHEDDFALLNMGLGSIYEMIAFPNHRPAQRDFIDLVDLPPAQLDAWTKGFVRFLKHVTWRSQREERRRSGIAAKAKQMVLKSPMRTAQIDVLLKLFPDARFIHIVRDPYELFSSTVRLWKTLCRYHGCQIARWDELPDGTPSIEDFVLETFVLLYVKFFEDRSEVSPERICEIRYEDLIREPLDELSRVYNHLGLGGFQTVRKRHEENMSKLYEYRPRRDLPNDVDRTKVARQWSRYIKQYGYDEGTP